jgi:diguanylate cyclase (GGDEF)-like protein/PAS domain S-box-containing protein
VEAIITIDARGVVEGFNPGAERTFGWRADEVVGRNVSMLMPEPDSSHHDEYMREYRGGRPPRVIGIGREVVGLRKSGETFPMALSVAEMWLAGRQMFTGIARDLTDLKRAEEGLRRAETQRAVAREQEALRRVATSVAGYVDAREIFILIAREIAGLLDAEVGIVSRFTDGEAHVVGASGAGAGALDGARLPLHGSSALAEVARTGRSSRVDYATLPDDPIGRRALTLGFSTGVAAPVMVGGVLWGALLVAATGDRTVDESAEPRLAHFADLLSLAISNAESRERLAEQALTDPLTGLVNRRGFRVRLDEEISRARRQGAPLGLVMIDVDHFKRVNDTHGHQAGDKVLAAIAHEISTHVRQHEVVARVGGEEFAWILPGTDTDGSWHAAERARLTVAALAIPEVGHVTVSAGVSDLGPRTSAEDLFREADDALYRAKNLGRNRCERVLPQELAPERPAG